MTRGLHVTDDVGSGAEPFLAAVAATVVDLPADEVDQLHLLIEPEIWGRRGRHKNWCLNPVRGLPRDEKSPPPVLHFAGNVDHRNDS